MSLAEIARILAFLVSAMSVVLLVSCVLVWGREENQSRKRRRRLVAFMTLAVLWIAFSVWRLGFSSP